MKLYYFLRWSVIVLLGLLIYGQSFQFGFVFDDNFFIVDNPYIKNFSQIHSIWHFFPMTRAMGFYSFALNYFFNQLHPQGYHVFNFIVHLISVGLVWALAGLLFKITKMPEDSFTREMPFIIAVLFLVHPCQTQAVSYISQRFESMATVFYLGTIYCYLSARVSAKKEDTLMCPLFFGLAGFFTILGILTKEVVITVPAMILASEWILFPSRHSGPERRRISTRIYIILAAGGALLYLLFSRLVHADLSLFLQSMHSQSHDGDVITPSRYFLTQMRVFLTFLRLLVLPIHQNLDYDYPASSGLLQPPLTLLGLCVMGGIILLIVKLRRSVPLIAFGLAWVLITFSINLAPRMNVIFEHKLYLISFGFFLTTVVLLSHLVPNRRALMWILWCIILALAFTSFQRNQVWKSEFTIWDDAVQKSPHKARPYTNRGRVYAQEGKMTQALADYNKAIEIYSNYEGVYYNRGNAYRAQGQLTQALADYNKAIEINPKYADAYNNRGGIYDKEGNFIQAISDYSKAIAINLQSAEGYYNRGTTYMKQGNLIQAMSDYNKAIAINPDYAHAYNNRGLIYSIQGDLTRSLSDFNKAIEINPNYADAYKNRSALRHTMGKDQ